MFVLLESVEPLTLSAHRCGSFEIQITNFGVSPYFLSFVLQTCLNKNSILISTFAFVNPPCFANGLLKLVIAAVVTERHINESFTRKSIQ